MICACGSPAPGTGLVVPLYSGQRVQTLTSSAIAFSAAARSSDIMKSPLCTASMLPAGHNINQQSRFYLNAKLTQNKNTLHSDEGDSMRIIISVLFGLLLLGSTAFA